MADNTDRFARLYLANARLEREVDAEVASFDRDSLESIIVERLVIDLSDRRGLRGEWDQIDDDIKRKIEAHWRLIVRQVLCDSEPS